MTNRRYDLKDIRPAASGHWSAIINRIGGIEDDYLTTTHRDCPRCGGNDRWRVFDDFEQTGGAVCNQCGKFGDGIALLQWILGIGFPEALTKVGEFLGVQPGKTKSKSKPEIEDAAKQLEWLKWNDMEAARWCRLKGGITPEGLLAIGAKQAYYRGQFSVIAIPIFDIDGDEIGYSLYRTNNETIPHKLPGKPIEHLKVKTVKIR